MAFDTWTNTYSSMMGTITSSTSSKATTEAYWCPVGRLSNASRGSEPAAALERSRDSRAQRRLSNASGGSRAQRRPLTPAVGSAGEPARRAQRAHRPERPGADSAVSQRGEPSDPSRHPAAGPRRRGWRRPAPPSVDALARSLATSACPTRSWSTWPGRRSPPATPDSAPARAVGSSAAPCSGPWSTPPASCSTPTSAGRRSAAAPPAPATNLELDLDTGGGAPATPTAAGCWPGCAAPRRPSS